MDHLYCCNPQVAWCGALLKPDETECPPDCTVHPDCVLCCYADETGQACAYCQE